MLLSKLWTINFLKEKRKVKGTNKLHTKKTSKREMQFLIIKFRIFYLTLLK